MTLNNLIKYFAEKATEQMKCQYIKSIQAINKNNAAHTVRATSDLSQFLQRRLLATELSSCLRTSPIACISVCVRAWVTSPAGDKMTESPIIGRIIKCQQLLCCHYFLNNSHSIRSRRNRLAADGLQHPVS